MKALIISEDETLVSNCSNFLSSKNYDIIVYKWLLKALDNIEEIKPDLIIVSSSEYPRHWKTLVQFVKSGIGGENTLIYLYEPTPLSSEDEEKAKILGITGYFTDEAELENLFTTDDAAASEEVPQVSDIIQEEAPKAPLFGHVIFTNPVNSNFITGKVTSTDGSKLNCELDFDCTLTVSTYIKQGSYIWDGTIKSFEAEITSVSGKEIVLKISRFYEEV